MEVEINPISLDDRLKYIQQISSNQVAKKPKFQWTTAILCFVTGVIVVVGVLEYRKRQQQRKLPK